MLNRRYTVAMERSAQAEERIAAAAEKIAASVAAMLRSDKSAGKNPKGNSGASINGQPRKSEGKRRP